jgi:hypothetical protein
MNEAPMPEPQDTPSVPEQVPMVTLPDAVMFPRPWSSRSSSRANGR